jgi:hypothetical protein
MTTFREVWPVALVVLQLLQALLLYSFKATIRNAVLELKLQLAKEHYTKAEVDERVALADRVAERLVMVVPDPRRKATHA